MPGASLITHGACKIVERRTQELGDQRREDHHHQPGNRDHPGKARNRKACGAHDDNLTVGRQCSKPQQRTDQCCNRQHFE
jgi:hypothetical protein